jgi:hypothetical protein
MVSIHCPPGYEPGALPLRHSADEMLLAQPYENIFLVLSLNLTITGLDLPKTSSHLTIETSSASISETSRCTTSEHLLQPTRIFKITKRSL